MVYSPQVVEVGRYGVNFAVEKSKTEDISAESSLFDPRPAGSDEGREFKLETAKLP
jgi:hypothetical protein